MAKMTPSMLARRSNVRRAPLTPRLILEESLRLLDTGGVGGFSLHKLGLALEADPTAIYRHFKSKDDLVLALADRLIEDAIEGFAPSNCWLQTVSDLAYRIRAVYRAHPAAASLSSLRTTQRPAEMQAVEWLVGAMREAGFEGDQAAISYRAFADFSLCWAVSEATFLSLEPAQREADLGAWARAYRSVGPGERPNIWAIRDALPNVTEDAIFAEVLSLVLTGLNARAPVPCRCPPGTHPLVRNALARPDHRRRQGTR